jgi:sporulation integral membrane protein YtvI
MYKFCIIQVSCKIWGAGMLTFYKKYWKTAFDIALIVLTVFLIMWTFSFLYNIAAPIFLGFIIFAIIEPFAKFMNKRGIKKSIATAISVLVFTLIILSLLVGAGVIFVQQTSSLLLKLPTYTNILQNQIILKTEYLQDKIAGLSPELVEDITDKAKEYATTVAEAGANFIGWFLNHLILMVGTFSGFIVNFIIGIILAYFLSLEIDTWKRLAKTKTPNTFKTAFFFLKDNVLIGIGGYIKAQLKLITITFVIVFIALLLLQVNNAFSVALLAAFFDILPLLGVSTLFIPWIVYLLIVGKSTLAIWLSVLLGIVILFRQILEPKITGDSLGVSAFTMLSFMIISLSIFGVAGLILSPILIILIKALVDQGYLRRWIRLPEEEYDIEPD